MEREWSYEWQAPQSDGKWQASGKRFPTSVLAAQAAGEWLFVCVENEFYIAVRVFELDK